MSAQSQLDSLYLPGEDKTWTRGLWDPYFGPGPWTTFMDRVHGPPVMDRIHGHYFQIMSAKILDLTRSCRPMLVIVHKYLVVLTWRTLCLQMCSRKTVKLIQKLSAREELRAPVQRLALSSEKQAGVWNSLLLEQSKFSIIDVATV